MIVSQFLHGREPIMIALNIARHFPNEDVILPLPNDHLSFTIDAVKQKGLSAENVYVDRVAAAIADYVIWRNGMKYSEWVGRNMKYYSAIQDELAHHYTRFRAENLNGEIKEFKSSDARLFISTGGIYDGLGLDCATVYAFPQRMSELLKRSDIPNAKDFAAFLEKKESRRSRNFIPFVHTFSYDPSYQKLPNEDFTPAMKEEPLESELYLPDKCVGMIPSGTGHHIQTLKEAAKHCSYSIVVPRHFDLEGDNIIKVDPPYGEFVHVWAKPQVVACIARPGAGTYWNLWNAGKPIIYPKFEEIDDEEMRHIPLTIKEMGLGVEFSDPKKIDEAIAASSACTQKIESMNRGIMESFGTLDGTKYMADRIKALGLY